MDGTRWLDDQEHHAWRSYLAATRLLSAQLDRELQRDSQIPHTYYEILVKLSEAPDRSLRMSDLADASESSRSRLSHAVARLETNGWVRRESCPTDRRGAFAVLTDAGFTALANAAPAHVESVRKHLFDRLTREQVNQLAAICDSITEGLREQEAGTATGPRATADICQEAS
jgi:DNA-binding MarR family transcriptional regulator